MNEIHNTGLQNDLHYLTVNQLQRINNLSGLYNHNDYEFLIIIIAILKVSNTTDRLPRYINGHPGTSCNIFTYSFCNPPPPQILQYNYAFFFRNCAQLLFSPHPHVYHIKVTLAASLHKPHIIMCGMKAHWVTTVATTLIITIKMRIQVCSKLDGNLFS